MQGQGEEGIAQIRQGLSAYWAIGTETGLPYFLGLLAEAYGKVGQTEEGLTVLAEALAAVDKTGERWSEAVLYRLKGQLTLKRSGVRGPKSKRKRKRVFGRLLRLPVGNKRNRWSCGR